MLTQRDIFGYIFLTVTFLSYQYLIFHFADLVLENPKLKKKYRIFVGMLNGIFTGCFLLLETKSTWVYLFMIVLITIEFVIFYGDKISRVVAIPSVYMLHIMAVRAICVAVFSMYTGKPFYQIVEDPFLLIVSLGITFLLLDFALILVEKLIPADRMKIINQHDEQFWFLVLWASVCNGYLIYNAQLYSVKEAYSPLNGNQIVTSFAILATLYIVIFFSIKTTELLGYKEKNSQLEQAIHQEQQYRDSIMGDALNTYEFNLTHNQMLNASDLPDDNAEADRYSHAIRILAERWIHSEDISAFLNTASISNLLYEFQCGRSEVIIEYRRLRPEGGYMWVKSFTNLVGDEETGEVRGFTYVKDIDEEKRTQLELKFKAERDSLTGLYNKGMTGKLIGEYLDWDKNNGLPSALLIIDVDYFKTVNDSLGHTFGDAVLCELAEKLEKIFRERDIIGRIGGDEFIAFMTNVKNLEAVNSKAMEICKQFHSVYTGRDGAEFQISSSIGIAISPMHGVTFEHLYKNADIALYNSKNKGKNTYTVYDGEEFEGYYSNRTEIDSLRELSQKGFKNNRIEYIFKILYGSQIPMHAVQSVLELLADHFQFSRGYVFENSKDGSYTSNTFEWCADGIKSELSALQNLPLENFPEAVNAFRENNMYYLRSMQDASPEERQLLEPQGIKSMLQFGMFEQGNFMGFIGFDDCVNERTFTHAEIDEMSTICSVLSTFIIKHRAMEAVENHVELLTNLMNLVGAFIYVIDAETYEMLFVNQPAKQLSSSVREGNSCHDAFRGEQIPCDGCILEELGKQLGSKAIQEIYNEKFGIWSRCTAYRIKWINGKQAVLISCVDITSYKQ